LNGVCRSPASSSGVRATIASRSTWRQIGKPSSSREAQNDDCRNHSTPPVAIAVLKRVALVGVKRRS
jgi:hypothetical protein